MYITRDKISPNYAETIDQITKKIPILRLHSLERIKTVKSPR